MKKKIRRVEETEDQKQMGVLEANKIFKNIMKKSKIDGDKAYDCYHHHFFTKILLSNITGDSPIFTKRFIKRNPMKAITLKHAFYSSNFHGMMQPWMNIEDLVNLMK